MNQFLGKTTLLLFLFSGSFPQSINAQINIDSIDVLLSEYPKDTNKVLKLIEVSRLSELNPSDASSFARQALELSTAIEFDLGVAKAHNELGKISKEQKAAEHDVWQTSLHNPNFAEYATTCGALGIRVEKREDLIPAMIKIRDHDGPALLDIVCDAALI